MQIRHVDLIYMVLLCYIRTYVQTYMLTYLFTYLLAYLLTYIHTYILTYLHTYTLTYLHTYIRTNACIRPHMDTCEHTNIFTKFIYIYRNVCMVWEQFSSLSLSLFLSFSLYLYICIYLCMVSRNYLSTF